MKIDPAQHGWMTAPETVAVMNALCEARFVGGPRRAKWPEMTLWRLGSLFPAILRDSEKNRRRHAH
ncbi:MAG TPA: hypothetical protein VHX18_08470 [Rhizomicrobium sp.]|jgi:hypothetical protein|nr:hypothetical protein [Rhizomicrobium sp.]